MKETFSAAVGLELQPFFKQGIVYHEPLPLFFRKLMEASPHLFAPLFIHTVISVIILSEIQAQTTLLNFRQRFFASQRYFYWMARKPPPSMLLYNTQVICFYIT